MLFFAGMGSVLAESTVLARHEAPAGAHGI